MAMIMYVAAEQGEYQYQKLRVDTTGATAGYINHFPLPSSPVHRKSWSYIVNPWQGAALVAEFWSLGSLMEVVRSLGHANRSDDGD